MIQFYMGMARIESLCKFSQINNEFCKFSQINNESRLDL